MEASYENLKLLLVQLEGYDENINLFSKLENREIMLVPTDSEYWKEWKEWKKTKGFIHDGVKEIAPLYISDKKANLAIEAVKDYYETLKRSIDPKIKEMMSVLNVAPSQSCT